ncbi:putative Isotrichodermin C-15 hydroxylase [Seiridium unicorne]|uniref:Isotrichodermin C-15 hydroxylase n=1 Tax=Seiridium unicorne TaxID=138068 RepID=A0ABR2UVS4_9PEZI
MYLSGTGHLQISELHAKYGPIVRVAPTELIFCYPESYEDIMGHRKKDEAENSKDPDFWGDHKHTMIGATRENHGRHQSILAHGFSNQAMVAQQPLIQGYISSLMQRLKQAIETGEAQEMVGWYNWTTFDIIGHLDEPFGCLEKAQYHPWISIVFNQVRSVAFMTTIHKFPYSKLLIMLALTKEQRRQFVEHFQLS